MCTWSVCVGSLLVTLQTLTAIDCSTLPWDGLREPLCVLCERNIAEKMVPSQYLPTLPYLNCKRGKTRAGIIKPTSNLWENKDEERRDRWEMKAEDVSSFLCHVLLALLIKNHCLNLLLYFGSKTLKSWTTVSCVDAQLKLLPLETKFNGLDTQICKETKWLLVYLLSAVLSSVFTQR